MAANKGPLVSVIIPVYNVEQYLDKCVESVCGQTYENLEILLVDDGSTDHSGVRCDEYALRDSRIRVIHKKNGGLSDARNAALDVMQGEYITFVDSDDYVDKRLVERLFACISENECDFVVGGFVKTIAEIEDERNSGNDVRQEVLEAREAMLRMLYRKAFPAYAHGKLYRAELFSKLRFPVGKLFEDTITTYYVIKKAKRVGMVDYPMYYYRQRPGSIINTGYRSARLDAVYHDMEMLKDAEGDEELHKAAEAHLFCALMDNYVVVDKEHKEDRKFLENNIKKYRSSVLGNSKEGMSMRMLAFLTYFPGMKFARMLGRAYKMKNQRKWMKEAKKYQ